MSSCWYKSMNRWIDRKIKVEKKQIFLTEEFKIIYVYILGSKAHHLFPTFLSVADWDNPMDKGAWQATVYRVTKRRTWLSNWARTYSDSSDLLLKNRPYNRGGGKKQFHSAEPGEHDLDQRIKINTTSNNVTEQDPMSPSQNKSPTCLLPNFCL